MKSYPEITRQSLERFYQLIPPFRLNDHLEQCWKCAACSRFARFQPSQFVAAFENRTYWFRQKRLVLSCPYCTEKTLVRIRGFLRLELETVAKIGL